jgi:hypothetical protein
VVRLRGVARPYFDAVVLLTAPAEVMLDRIQSRTTNHYGKQPDERDLILAQLAEIRANAPRHVHARDRRDSAD